MTKTRPVKNRPRTVIAAGAFHTAQTFRPVSGQGAFLRKGRIGEPYPENFQQILTEPKKRHSQQYTELLAAEGVQVKFSQILLRQFA